MTNEALKESNLVGLYIDTPYNEIMTFVEKQNSKNTKVAYLGHYIHMFKFICNKNLSELTWNDVESITIKKVKDYRTALSHQYKATTINSKIFACKSLWDEFNENEHMMANVFGLKKLEKQNNCYDALTSDEFKQLLKFAQTKYKGNTQRLYFYFLYRTLFRKHIAQNLTWDQIIRKHDKDLNRKVWVIKAEEKRGIREVAITDEFYNELRENYNTYKKQDNKVFHICNSVIDDTIKDFCKEYDIDRRIVQHSIRSSGGDEVQEISGDINKTAQALGHKNIQTTYEHYINKNKSYSSQPSFELDQRYSIELLKGLGEDILLKLIVMAKK